MNNSDNNKDIGTRIKQQNIHSMKLSSLLEKYLKYFLIIVAFIMALLVLYSYILG